MCAAFQGAPVLPATESTMTQDTEPTKTIFRCWPDGNVLALFPRQAGTNDASTCGSYEHVGQHGAADAFHVMQTTRPAAPTEYADLLAELESIGYRVKVAARCHSSDRRERQKQVGA